MFLHHQLNENMFADFLNAIAECFFFFLRFVLGEKNGVCRIEFHVGKKICSPATRTATH